MLLNGKQFFFPAFFPSKNMKCYFQRGTIPPKLLETRIQRCDVKTRIKFHGFPCALLFFTWGRKMGLRCVVYACNNKKEKEKGTNRYKANLRVLFWLHCSRLQSFTWHCIPPEVKFHDFIGQKSGNQKFLGIFFLISIQQHLKVCIKQITKFCHIHFIQ